MQFSSTFYLPVPALLLQLHLVGLRPRQAPSFQAVRLHLRRMGLPVRVGVPQFIRFQGQSLLQGLNLLELRVETLLLRLLSSTW